MRYPIIVKALLLTVSRSIAATTLLLLAPALIAAQELPLSASLHTDLKTERMFSRAEAGYVDDQIKLARAFQFVPQDGAVLGSFSKPLKADGASPPLNVFSFAHCALQKVTWVPTAEFPSPITKLPPTDVPKIRTTHEVVAVEPPSSTIETVMVKNPVEPYM